MLLKPKGSESSKTKYPFVPETLQAFCVPMAGLKPWSKNPRKNDEAAPKLAELIRKHGFRKPIVVDQNNIIRAGNTAFKAAKLLGMSMIPVAKSTFSSEVAATAFGISDNKASEFALWDDELLSELMEVEELKAGRAQTGFSERELNLINTDSRVDTLGRLQEEGKEWLHTIKIMKIKPEDKDLILGLVKEALGGTGYEAKIF